jgi:hypothetical protein
VAIVRLQHRAIALEGNALTRTALGKNPIATRLLQASTDRGFRTVCAGCAGGTLVTARSGLLLLIRIALGACWIGRAAIGVLRTLIASAPTASTSAA